jgi:pimeloyl-ACP methyl ester carboxylesterase
MATFVLVHGAYQGSWVYTRLARILRAAGHDVYSPTLTGLGERSHLAHPEINLDTHIQDIVNVLQYRDLQNVILCGHSYGGMVITGVAHVAGERIRTLCYLDAYAPTDGQSLFDIVGTEIAQAFEEQGRAHAGMLPPIPAELFNVNAADADWVNAMSTMHPLASFTQSVRAGVETAPVAKRTFIYATKNGGNWFASTYEKLKDDPCWSVHTLACGHAVMLDKTDELAQLLLLEV